MEIGSSICSAVGIFREKFAAWNLVVRQNGALPVSMVRRVAQAESFRRHASSYYAEFRATERH